MDQTIIVMLSTVKKPTREHIGLSVLRPSSVRENSFSYQSRLGLLVYEMPYIT